MGLKSKKGRLRASGDGGSPACSPENVVVSGRGYIAGWMAVLVESLGGERAALAGDGVHLYVCAAPVLPGRGICSARQWRIDRLVWSDRVGSWRSRRDDHPGARGFAASCWLAGIQRLGPPGQGWAACVAIVMDEAFCSDGLPRGVCLKGPPELGALWVCLGRVGRGGILLACRQPADSEEAGRHAGGHRPGVAGLFASGVNEGGSCCRENHLDDEAQQLRQVLDLAWQRYQ